MYKHPHRIKQTYDMNYIVPGLALYSAKGRGLAEFIGRFFEFFVTWTERLGRRSTGI